MKTINIEKINSELLSFIEERDWDQFHNLKNLAMALSVESSELCEIFQWLNTHESNNLPNDPKLKEKLSHEIADVFIYLLRIASKANIDIEQAVLTKIEHNNLKYPVEKSRGSVKKYTEF